MIDIFVDPMQISIFNYYINKRFNFCLNYNVLEIFDIINTEDGIDFKLDRDIKLTDKQIEILKRIEE